MKPLFELQNAIKANDTANIPAKLAAAQAAATTKEDHYLDCALPARDRDRCRSDNAGLATAVDALANSGILETDKIASGSTATLA